MSKFRKLILLSLAALTMASCGTTKKYVLINDINVDSTYTMPPMQQLRIKRGDDLRIVVTHKLPQLAAMFNNKINDIEGGESLTTFTVNNDG